MLPDAHELAEVVVKTPPIIIKKDTFEFRAGAFATKPNATAEDLLNKLPGMEVDKDGNITLTIKYDQGKRTDRTHCKITGTYLRGSKPGR